MKSVSLSVTARAMLAALFANGVFGLSFLFSKAALVTVSPLTLLAGRFLLAFVLMNLLLLTRRVHISLGGKPVWKLLLLGLFQPVIYFICENYGVVLTTATFSAVMIALIPIAALVLGIPLLREIPTVWQALFSVLAVGGVVFMAVLKSEDGTVHPLGIVLLIGAVIAAVLFNATSRRLAGEFSPVERTYVMFLLACAVFVPAALIENRHDLPAMAAALAQPSVLGAVVFLGVVCSVGAFLALNFANTHLPLARSMAFANVTTVVSVIAGLITGDEQLHVLSLIAAVLILVGVWGVQKFAARENPSDKP